MNNKEVKLRQLNTNETNGTIDLDNEQQGSEAGQFNTSETNGTISTNNEQQGSEAGQFNKIVRELPNTQEEQQIKDETSFDNNAAKLKNIETEVQGPDGQSDNLARDFNTGNLVKQFDETETDDQVIQNEQFNNFDNNLEELTDEEDEEKTTRKKSNHLFG